MEKTYPEAFDYVVENACKLGKKCRVVIAGADNENILQGAFMAQEAGFAKLILLGDESKINPILEKIGKKEEDYTLISMDAKINAVQYAIDMIKSGNADILMRGNTETRDFLLPILNRVNHLVIENRMLTLVEIHKLERYEKPFAISDCTFIIEPSPEERKKVVQNMVRCLRIAGVNHPNIALLSLVETPSFHMRDSVTAALLVEEQKERPFADCNLVGPIAYDLIMSMEAARLKGYDCAYCGEFDGIVAPDLMSCNVMSKILKVEGGSSSFGVIMGANIPIAITSRSDPPTVSFLSLAAAAVMTNRGKELAKQEKSQKAASAGINETR